MKHDLKGVLKCIGVKIWTPYPTYRDGHFSNPSLIITDTVATHLNERETVKILAYCVVSN